MLGIALFYVLEGFLERLLPSHSHDHLEGVAPKAAAATTQQHDDPVKGIRKRKSAGVDEGTNATTPRPRDEAKLIEHDDADTKNRSAALLSLLADFSHNVMDGVAIGTAFAASSSRGQRVVAVILAHEVPHELADFAVLKMCGWKRRSIVASQLLTALGNLIGTLIAFYVSSWSETVEKTLEPIVAGSFLYLALCVIFPQLKSCGSSPVARVAHGLAFIAGAYFLSKL
jgi:zinc transporter ZupT